MHDTFSAQASNAEKFRHLASEIHLGIIRSLTGNTDFHRGIHDARRGIKMYRALLRLFRFELGEKKYQEENIFYRDVGRRLSFLRDLTAMLETLDQLEEEFHFKSGKMLPPVLREKLEERRTNFSKKNTGATVSEAALLKDKKPILTDWKFSKEYPTLILKGLKKTYRQGHKDAHSAQRHRLPFYVHDWRKRAKYLRYQFKLLEDVDIAKFSSIEKELHRLTDLLGDFNNLTVLMWILPKNDIPINDGEVILLMHFMFKKQEDLLDEALTLGNKLYSRTANQFELNLKNYLGEIAP